MPQDIASDLVLDGIHQGVLASADREVKLLERMEALRGRLFGAKPPSLEGKEDLPVGPGKLGQLQAVLRDRNLNLSQMEEVMTSLEQLA